MFLASYESQLTIPGPCGDLVGIYAQPTTTSRNINAILFHPNPSGGGNCNHKILATIARSLSSQGIASWRFNTRGVGPGGAINSENERSLLTSAGRFENGPGEILDSQAIWQYVAQQHPSHALILGGFSFGSYLACSLAAKVKTDLLLTIAPAVTMYNYPDPEEITIPWSLLQNIDDEVVNAQANLAWAERNASIMVTTYPTGGHFFHGLMPIIQEWLLATIQQTFPPGEPTNA